MASILKSPIEDALSKAPAFGLPDTFQQSVEGRQTPTFTPGNVPFQAEFNAASQRYGVPVNVLMALADQESSFNPTALGQPTKYGRAQGMMQYIPSTAAAMGINPYDPVQSIDAAAKQLKTRLDQGYSMQEAVQAHFGGDDRRQWGEKTRAYGAEVMGKAQRYFDGTAAPVKATTQGQQPERDWANDFPAAQSAMENMQQNELRTRAIRMDNLLGQLNKDEPGRYRQLTPEEVQQYMAEQAKQNPQAAQTDQKQAAQLPTGEKLDFTDANKQLSESQQKVAEQNRSYTDQALSLLKDTGLLLNSGLNTAANDAKELVGRIPYVGKAIVDAADRFDRWNTGKGSDQLLQENQAATEKAFSPELQAARKKSFVIEPGDDLGDGKKANGYNFGPAWSDPRAYMSGILESVPEMALTMGGSGRLAQFAYKKAIAAGATKEAAAAAAARTATVAGGILEGGMSGAQSARETRQQILQMTPDQLKDSTVMQTLMAPDADGKRKTFEQARAELAENAATKAFTLAGVTTGMFGGMGDRALAKIITGNSGRLKAAFSGFLGEGLFEEAPQSATQQMSQNYAMQDADPNTPLMKGVANQAAGGLAVGGLMGAGMGAAAPRAGEAQPTQSQEQPQVNPAQAEEQQAQATEEQAVATAPTPTRDDTGLSDDAGPLERAVRGTAPQPDATNGNFWGGEPGTTINMQAKGDPETAMVATVERYERDGSMTVRGEDGTPYTVSPDEVDVTSSAAAPQSTSQQMQDAGTAQEVKDERAAAQPEETPEDAQKRQDDIEKALKKQGIDPQTGEVLEEQKPARQTRTEDAPAERQLTDMSEDELRDRMRYLASQAKQSGWDTRLTKARRDVEKVLNAKVAERQKSEASTVAGNADQPAGVEVAATEQGNQPSAVRGGNEGSETDRRGGQTGNVGSDIVAGAGRGVDADTSAPVASADGSEALTGADGKPKWFSTAEKAQGHLDKKSLTGYKVVEVKPRRFELHRDGTLTDGGTSGAVVNSGAENAKALTTQAESRATAPKTVVNPRTNRAKKLVGDVGDVVSPSESMGYVTAGQNYRIKEIEKNGTVHLENVDTGGGTTMNIAELERARGRKVEWSKSAPAVAETATNSAAQQRAETDRSMTQDDNADSLQRLQDAVQAGKISPADAQTITERAMAAAKKMRDRSAAGYYIDEAVERLTGVEPRPNEASLIEEVEHGRRVATKDAGPLKLNALGNEWQTFPADSGTLNVPRAEMPQIKAEHRGAMVNFLEARGVGHREGNVPADTLKPTQAEFSPQRVARAAENTDSDRSILVSSDGYVVDGHHQWLAARDNRENVKAIVLDAPVRQLLPLLHEFPSSLQDTSSAAGVNQNAENVKQNAPDVKQIGSNVKQDASRTEWRLRTALESATRPSGIRGMEGTSVADPIAADVLDSGRMGDLAVALEKAGVEGPFTATGAGASSIVLRASGNKAVRLGIWRAEQRPDIPEVLQASDHGNVGPVGYEVLPLVDTSGITEADVQSMSDALAKRGYRFSDAGTDNLGKLDGRLVVTDPGAVTASNEGAKTEVENSEARPADYGANNKLVSQDRAAELRKKLKAKFSQLNSGIDPEILAIGTELAVFHIEAGVRKFADFARTMAADLDIPLPRLRPYLRSWFNGARDMMEDSGVSIEGMDSPETVKAEMAKLNAAPEPAAATDTGARTSGALDDMVNTFDSEVSNVSSPRTGLESDRQAAGNSEPGAAVAAVNEPGTNGRNPAAAGDRAGTERRAGQRDQRVPDDGAAAGRESGNQRVYREDGQFGSPEGAAGGDISARSAGGREAGLSTERSRATAVAADAHAAGASDFNQRLAAQKKAPKTTKLGDADSVRASLPMLLPAQQDDVVKVERQHQKENGILITNGTGTGKTMSGLGVAKRFHNAGKENILIVVPSDKIASDWVKSSGWLDLPLKQLSGITDNGTSGPVITTYANLGQNDALAKREWDLVIPDESHRLMQNEGGDVTDQLRMFRALTGHPDGFNTWLQAKNSEQYAQLVEAQQARDKDAAAGNETAAAAKRAERYQQLLAKWNELYKSEQAKWRDRWSKQENLPKTVFMSATPFAYVMNTDYAEGYLFHHTPPAERFTERSTGGYNSGNSRDRFYIEHFGYRMRYNKLTRPDAEVNSELMEQNFNQWLKDKGALTGRSLDVPYDYDRKFILIDDAAGKKLDEALEYLNNGNAGQHRDIYRAVMDTFDHQRKMFLLESMKARAVIPVIKEHMALGRKVLVIHDYNQGGGFNPFAEALTKMDPELRPVARDLFQQPQFQINFSGLQSALETLTAAFPNALLFNGTVPKAKRRAAADRFNDDAGGPMLLIAQSDAMREGVSVHDTTGKHQRTSINLGLPTQPTKAIQLEGRTYRTGQASDAIFRYMTTGTAWEANAFATKLAERASTAENLAMGPESRALKQSFIDAFTGAERFKASPEDGKGGKAADQRESNTISEFDKAKSFYYAQQKNTGRRDQREGVDYFATPEPVGQKMVEWAGIRPGDKVLEPSAGHGAIARFFPAQTDVTMVEPSLNLSQRAALANGSARIVNSRFEDLSRTNKYDAIVMNPPYGMGGKTAYEHLTKADQHIREGGRIVALMPRGGLADKRFADFMNYAGENGLHLIADVAMPRSTFERAGTTVNTRVLVLEKHTDPEYQAPQPQRIDLSGAESVNELFDRIEHLDVNPRAPRPTASSEPQYNDLSDTDFAADAMAELAAHDEMFAYPRATGERTLQGVFDAVMPDVKIKWEAPQLDDNSSETGATHIRGVTGRGRDINIYETPDEVWFDVSNVKEGESGAGIYQAVADYALNTGRTFVGDPEGLSDIALRRRTEAMLSSALKHGTTDHLEPHQRQLDGDKALGVPPLRWRSGDFAFNIRSLIDTSLANITGKLPELDNARYDFNTGTYRDGSGQPLLAATIERWARSPVLREARVGSASIRRSILLNTLARTESSAQPGLLERLFRVSGQLLDRPLQNTFYDWDSRYGRLPEGNRIQLASRLRKLQQQQALGQLTPEQYSEHIGELADWLEDRRMESNAKRAFAERQRGADMVLERLHRARRRGEISDHAADIAIWALNRNPQLAEDLGISIREKGGNSYNRVERIARLVGGNMRDTTPIHEILHHTERMMPPGIQKGIVTEYNKAWKRAYDKATPELRQALDNMRLANFGDKKAQEATAKAFETGQLQYHEHYQLTNASEYWAVNAAEIMASRHAASSKGWVTRARQWLREFASKLKSVFGLPSDAAVLRGLNAILKGDGSFQSRDMLAVHPYADTPVRDLQQGDYADQPRSPSGMEPAPNIPTAAEDDSRLRSWWDRLKNLPRDKMTDAMDAGLAVVPMRPLVLELGRNLPAAREYMRLKQSMDAMRSEWHARTDAVAQRWLKYRKSNKTENEKLMALMHDSTLAQVDPSERFTARMTDRDRDALRTVAAGSDRELELVAKAAEDDRLREQWQKLNDRFKELSPEAQALFSAVRDEYTAIANEYEKVLMANMEKAIDVRIKKAEREHRYEMQRITDEGLTGQAKEDAVKEADRRLRVAKTKTAWNRKARITQLRQQFETERLQGPYFPLARFGNLFVTVRDAATGKVESFSRFEKAAEQREFAELMRKDPKYKVQVGTLDDTGATRKAVDAGFVADVEDILADLPNAEQVKDEVWQRYLESLPDFSIRKNRIHRTGRKGFISDALRAYGNQMFHSSHQLARLKHTFDMEEALDAAREEANNSKDPVRDGKVVNEMEKRHEFVMNPKGGPLVQAISQASFIYFLAASPKAAIVNLSQTAIMGVPTLAAFDGSPLGMTRAANQLMRALGDFTRGKGQAQNSKRLSDDERKAMQEAYDTGIIDRSQSHDLAGIGETGVEYSPARTKVMALLSWGFHQGERLNREVTYLAAYRMARAKGQNHATAVQTANELTWKTHFDYQNTSRPRVMHSDTMKALLVFRNFSINMLWRLFRDLHQSVKGDTPEVRREARIQLAGTTGMMMLNAGLTGTWFFGIAMMLAGMFMDDDKDPEAELKKNMIEALGPQMAGIVLDGVPGYLSGTSLSDSIGMRDLWFRDPSTSLEGKGAMDYWKSQVLGAPPSIIDNAIKGYQMIQDGQVYRGIETMMPKAIKDPMKAYRYATEGATNKRGDVIVQDIDTGDVIRQALGFTPAKLAEQYDLNNAGYNMQQNILNQRKKLMDAYFKADQADDTAALDKLDKDIDAYNDKYPEMEITPKTLRRSAKTREQNAEDATGGMRYNRKLRDRILEDQSPTIYR